MKECDSPNWFLYAVIQTNVSDPKKNIYTMENHSSLHRLTRTHSNCGRWSVEMWIYDIISFNSCCIIRCSFFMPLFFLLWFVIEMTLDCIPANTCIHGKYIYNRLAERSEHKYMNDKWNAEGKSISYYTAGSRSVQNKVLFVQSISNKIFIVKLWKTFIC